MRVSPINVFFAALLASFVLAFGVQAAPKNTLPPGFSSSPLDQPKLEDDDIPQKPDYNDPLEKTVSGNLPLLDQTLLLPVTTGLLFGKIGLGDDIWLGSDEALLHELLDSWQVQPRTWPAAQLARRFLLTQAQPPTNIEPYDFVLMRLEKLYILGDLPSIKRFFELYPVLAAREKFDLLYQKTIFSSVGNSTHVVSDGCALWRAAKRDNVMVEARALQIEAMCLAVGGQSGLGLAKAERLSDSNQAPPEFFPLLATALGNTEKSLSRSVRSPSKINSVLWSLYKANGKRPTSLAIKNVEPSLLPVMAGDVSLPHGWRLALTQIGVLRGIIPARKLQAFYESKESPPDDFVPPLKFKRTHQENRAEAQRISNILSTAPTRAAYMALLYAWGRDIANLRLSSSKKAANFGGYRPIDGMAASLLFNQNDGLKIWLDQRGNPGQAPAIRAMLEIMKEKSSQSPRGVSRQVLGRWRNTMEKLIKITEAEFFKGSDSGLPDGDETQEGDAIIDAALGRRSTEVLLRVLSGLDNPALGRDPSFLRAVVKGLRAIGLERDAWRIMIDSFLTESWGA